MAEPGPTIFKYLNSFYVGDIGIPFIGMLIGAYAQLPTNESIAKLRFSAGCDIFSFLCSLDAVILMNRQVVSKILSTKVLAHFYPIFVLLLIFTFLMILFSGRVQCKIAKRRKSAYPLLGVLVSWTLAVALIAFHLFLLTG